ncbi:MAG: hypothetical protein ACQXXJ_02210 [Candidatus Bathyarchaeia archaeon]
MKRFIANRRGVGGVIYTLIVLMVMLLVAIITVNAVVNSQTPNSTWSAQANATWAQVQSYVWVALGLASVSLIILGAVSLINYLNVGQS